MRENLKISIFLVLFISVELRGQDSLSSASATTQITTKIEEALSEPQYKKLEGSVTLEHSSNLMAESNPDEDMSTSLIFEAKYNFSEKSKLAGRIDFLKYHDSEAKTDLTDTLMILTPTTIDLSRELKFKPNISATFPTSKFNREDTSFRGGLTLRPTLEYKPHVLRNLTIGGAIHVSKNFHEYEVKKDFSPNAEFGFRNRLVVVYKFTESLSVELLNDYLRSWSYNGYAKDDFYFGQTLYYKFLKNWIASLSHKNGGSVRGPNNNGNNIEVFDERRSYVSVGLGHVF